MTFKAEKKQRQFILRTSYLKGTRYKKQKKETINMQRGQFERSYRPDILWRLPIIRAEFGKSLIACFLKSLVM